MKLYSVTLHEMECPDSRDEIWTFDSEEKATAFEKALTEKLHNAGPEIEDHFEVTSLFPTILNNTRTDYLDEFIEDIKTWNNEEDDE